MRQLGEKYIENNRGGSFQVKSFDSRPQMLIVPPPWSSNRPRSMNFVEAVTTLPAHFSDDHLTQIFMVVGNNNRGLLRQLFLVLNDDDHDRCLDLVKKFHEERQRQHQHQRHRPHDSRSGHQSQGQGGSGVSQSQTHAGAVTGVSSGMEVESTARFDLPPSFSDAFRGQKEVGTPPIGQKEVDTPPRGHHSRRGRAGKTSRTAAKKRPRSPSRSRSRSPWRHLRSTSRSRSKSPRRRHRSSSRSRSRSRSRSLSHSPTPKRSSRRNAKKRSRRSPSHSSSASGSDESVASGRGSRKSKKSKK